MTAGFDDFFSELRTQLAHSAEVAARESARPAREPAHRPWQVRPRIALAFAAGLLVPAIVAGVILVSSLSSPGVKPPPQAGGLLPGAEPGSSPAFVIPVAPVVSPSPGDPGGAPVEPSYSLWAVAATGVGDAWAVGSRSVTDGRTGSSAASFILRWNGATWRETVSPDVGPLSAVAAVSSGEAWALNGAAGAVVHFSGGRWTTVTSGVPDGCTLNALAVTAANDVWAVGSQGGVPLILHWNGYTWQPAELPALASAGSLTAVSSSSGSDVWAVGADATGSQALILRYDGVAWAPVEAGADASATDAGSAGASIPQTVAAVSAADVWTGGIALRHWDGTQWSELSTATAAISGPMSVGSAADIWARGDDRRSVVHWDGATWQTVDVSEMGLPADTDSAVQAVAAIPGGGVWVVGTSRPVGASAQRPLIVRGDGHDWGVVVDAAQASGEE